MTGKRIILGSSSKWRKQVLEEMGYQFTDIDEKAIRDPDPKTLTRLISRAKAEALLERLKGEPPALLITSDQVITWKGQIREKPENEEECRAFLRSYAEAPAVAVVSVCVVDTETNKIVEGTDIAIQHFKPIPEHFIEELIKQGDVLGCAGGFTVEQIDMSEYVGLVEGEITAITGLPAKMTQRLLEDVQK